MNDALKQKILERCKLNLPPMHRQTEHDDGKEFMHDELMPVVTELLDLVERLNAGLELIARESHGDARAMCGHASGDALATLSRLAGGE